MKEKLTDMGDSGNGEKMEKSRNLYFQSEKGIALVVVLVLSAVALAIVTALIYMIMVGTQTSGMQKRYRTALEAGLAGTNILSQAVAQCIALQSNCTPSTLDSSIQQSLSVLPVTDNVSTACTGTSTLNIPGHQFQGLAAKIMTSTTATNEQWSQCDTSLMNVSGTPDMQFQLGTYTVYTKIVDAIEGNSSASGTVNAGGNTLLTRGVVAAGSGEVPVTSIPYQYTIEVEAENTNMKSPERAKLSVLYEY